MPRVKVDPQVKQKESRQEAFLEHYRNLGNIRLTCEKVNIHRSTYHKWIREDPDFVIGFESAKEDANDSLIKEARRRAVKGVPDAVYYKGKVVGVKTWHSDTLLMFLLKAGDPGVFRENNGVGGASGSGPGRTRPGGDRLKIHVKQEVLADAGVAEILCDLEEALANAGIGTEAD